MNVDFAIIGAQKSASTFVQRRVQGHPDVFLPAGELATFEDPDYASFNDESFAAHFAPGCGAQAVGLKRPNYLHRPEVPARLHRHLPNAKLIAVLRDPIQRAVSAYFHQVRHGFAPAKDVNTGLRAILEGHWEKRYPRTSEVILFGLYHAQLERYLSYYDRNQIFLATYRAVKEQPQTTMQSIYRFIGVDSTFVPSMLGKQANVGVYSIPRLRVRRLMNPIRFTYHHGGQRLEPRESVGFIGRVAMRAIRKIDRTIMQRIFSNERPVLNSKVQKALAAYYHADAESLRDSFGLDIDHWSVFQL
jgi:hypothetical protein